MHEAIPLWASIPSALDMLQHALSVQMFFALVSRAAAWMNTWETGLGWSSICLRYDASSIFYDAIANYNRRCFLGNIDAKSCIFKHIFPYLRLRCAVNCDAVCPVLIKVIITNDGRTLARVLDLENCFLSSVACSNQLSMGATRVSKFLMQVGSFWRWTLSITRQFPRDCLRSRDHVGAV